MQPMTHGRLDYFVALKVSVCFQSGFSLEYVGHTINFLSHVYNVSSIGVWWIHLKKVTSDPQDIALIQIRNILAPGAADPSDQWHSCKLDIRNCSPDQLSKMQGEHFLVTCV